MGKDALVSFPEHDIKDSVSKSQFTEPEIQAAIKVVKDIVEKTSTAIVEYCTAEINGYFCTRIVEKLFSTSSNCCRNELE